MKSKNRAFTLIEILVVLGIIMLLAAILFPVFKRMQIRGYQANCMSNMNQIQLAVKQYHIDYKRYPGSLAFVISDSVKLPTYTASGVTDTVINTNSKGLFKGGLDALVCAEDDTEATVVRSSYGDISTGEVSTTTTPNHWMGSPFPTSGVETDPGRYVYNYWGYSDEGWAYVTEADAKLVGDATPALLAKGSGTYDRYDNPLTYSLVNQYAPASTIITHCVFHRLQTADDVTSPTELYNSGAGAQNARDIVLRLDGSAKLLDVSGWKSVPNKWIEQTK